MDIEEIKLKDKEMKENLNSLMYQKLTSAEQEIVNNYISFLKKQIGNAEMLNRDKNYYKDRWDNEMKKYEECRANEEKWKNYYDEVCIQRARLEIELDTANAKIELLNKKLEMEVKKDEK